MTNYNYIFLYLFFYHYLFLKIESFTPAGRLAHSSVLVGKKIYFFGGVLDDSFGSNEVFYLDVSQPFNIDIPPWNDLTPKAGIPFKSYWGTVSSINNETIYLFGGETDNIATNENSFVSFVYSFNINSSTWNIPTVTGKSPERRREIQSVIDDTGRIHIFSGASVDSSALQTFNEMVIFNTVESSLLINVSPVIDRVSYTATLLPNGVIVYIGGYGSGSSDVDISQITLYDTKSSNWSDKVCTIDCC
jgi:hypothetical protein